MNFTKQIFISYTHIDNQPLAGQDRGWVTRLHETLSAQLEMRLGEKVEIWRDNKLAGNDIFADEIVAQLPQVGLLVSVLSPRYLRSDWCKREAAEFCRAAAATTGVEVGRKSRIIKVLKLPVERLEGLPDAFRNAIGFPFYKSKNEVPIEIDPAYGGEMVGDFNMSVAMLAQKLADTLEALRGAEGTALAAAERGTVYLAETSWDREPERKQLETELRTHGYAILPEAPLPSHELECRREAAKLLDGCKLSIHLVGNQSGMVPSGPGQKCVVELQNELAVLQCRARKFHRIIWAPDGTQSKNPEHQQFIDSLHRTEDAQFGADLITGDFESLKGATLATLRKLETPESAEPEKKEQQADEALIYVICDKKDSGASIGLRKFLKQHGFEAKRPLFEGDAAAVRKENERLLNQCHAAIVFYGSGDEFWFTTTDSEVRKVKSRAPVRTFVAAPATDHKAEMIELEGGALFNGLPGLPEAALSEFLEGLKGKAASGGTA